MFFFNKDKSGPAVKKLQELADQCGRFETSAVIEFDPYKPVPINAARRSTLIIRNSQNKRDKLRSLIELTKDEGYFYRGILREGLRDFGEICAGGKPFTTRGVIDFDSIKVNFDGGAATEKELLDAARAAWFEAFYLVVPTADELAAQKEAARQQVAGNKERFVQLLLSGDVKSWNAIRKEDKSACDFSGTKLVGANLSNLSLQDVTFRTSYFDDANLSNSGFVNADVRSARFRNANLKGASIAAPTQFASCDFTGANLTDATIIGDLEHCIFDNANMSNADISGNGIHKASFIGTNLSGAKFHDSDLRDVDLSQAKNLSGALFHDCFYRSNSKWPADFLTHDPDHLKFRGKGADPLLLAELMSGASANVTDIDFDTFMNNLNKSVNVDRIKKSLSMLRAERFQLFSEIADDSVIGVVRSQTNQELVYSCMLDNSGSYFCCTQNLRACGGLRGFLCKHILVLIIGLVKAEQISAAKTHQWVLKSRAQEADLKKTVATDIFIRYKGVEAGEIDWRPTETLPEDYYAY